MPHYQADRPATGQPGRLCPIYCAAGNYVTRPSDRKSKSIVNNLGALGALLCLALQQSPVIADSPAVAPDPRQAFNSDAPQWLQAVGRLKVPSQRYSAGNTRHFTEDCSASLVAGKSGSSSNIIVTAWHCIEYYHDLSRPIVFSPQGNTAHSGTYTAAIISHGGGMGADWALLRLLQPIGRDSIMPLKIAAEDNLRQTEVVMAGYSGDAGLGQQGQELTFDPTCHITRTAPSHVETDCRAYKGASGGAVMQRSSSGDAVLSGVISTGDSATLSRFVPVKVFRSALNAALQQR